MIQLAPDIETLARRLADAQSLSVEDVIRQALEARARATGVSTSPVTRERNPSPAAAEARRLRLDGAVQQIASMPVLDGRTLDQIIDDINAL